METKDAVFVVLTGALFVCLVLVMLLPARFFFPSKCRKDKTVTVYADDFQGPPINDEWQNRYATGGVIGAANIGTEPQGFSFPSLFESPEQYGFRTTLPITGRQVEPERVVNINIQAASSNIVEMSRSTAEAMSRLSEGIANAGMTMRQAAEALREFGGNLPRRSVREHIEEMMADEMRQRLDEMMLFGSYTGQRIPAGVDHGDAEHSVSRLCRLITAAERATGVISLRDEDRQALGEGEAGDTFRMDVEGDFVTFTRYRNEDNKKPHKDAGKEVIRSRMRRTVMGAVVTDVRMKDGSIQRSSDIGQPAPARPKLKIPGRRGN